MRDDLDAAAATGAPDTVGSAARTRWGALARALIGWAVLSLGVQLSITIARLVSDSVAAGPAFIPVLQAVLTSMIVVPAVVLLRRRLDHRPLQGVEGIGLARRWPAAAATGAAVGLGAGALVWVPAFWAGWIRLDRLELTTLIIFLVVNTAVLLLYEALPEELALRGYGWSTMREAWSPLTATATITVLFSLNMIPGNLITAAASALLPGVETTGFSLVPSGNDPIVYLIQMLVFGLALIAARRLPLPGALTAAIAFHVTVLTVNRALLGGLRWIDSGIGTQLAAPEVAALTLVHPVVGGVLLLLIRRRLERRSRNCAGRGSEEAGKRLLPTTSPVHPSTHVPSLAE